VNARTLLILFDIVYLVALAAWVGSALFLAFGVMPVISKLLGTEGAAKFERELLPRYYTWGATAGAIALAAFVSGPLSVPEFRGFRVAWHAGLLLAGTLIMLYCGNSLMPATNAASKAGPVGEGQRDRLRKRGAWLNGVVLVIGLVLLAAFATRPAPTTAGIVELSPEELARREDAQYQKVLDEAHGPAPAQSAKAAAPGQPAVAPGR
jgi:uncharacterized membrane protein